MKTLKLIVWLVFLCISSIYAQEKTQKIENYKTWVYLHKETLKIRCVLYKVKDSSILVTNIENGESQEIYIRDIQKIKIRKKNSIGKGALIGSVSGLVLGGAIGLIEGDDPPDQWIMSYTAEEKAVGYGVLLTPIGAGVGVLIGSIKKSFDINGKLENYKLNKQQLRKYAIKKE